MATPKPASPPSRDAPPDPPSRLGFWSRLFGLGPSVGRIDIRVSPFIDAAGQDQSAAILEILGAQKEFRVRTLASLPAIAAEGSREDALRACAQSAQGELTKLGADVIVWGDVPPPGTTLHVFFAAPPIIDDDPPGAIEPLTLLKMPVVMTPPLDAIFTLCTLAATNVPTDAKVHLIKTLLPPLLEACAAGFKTLPLDLSGREKASIEMVYANALAIFAQRLGVGELYALSLKPYRNALKGLSGDDVLGWARTQRNLGAVLQTMAERAEGDIETLEEAAKCYRSALERLSREAAPLTWASANNRLGEVLYKLDLISGETAGIKESLTLYQNALQVFNRARTPRLWAEVMTNFGQAAQVLGREMGNHELVERAIDACRHALEVRSREASPALWAAGQNNLGSALFLLGNMSGNVGHFEEALGAFVAARDIYVALAAPKMIEVTERNIAYAESRLPGTNAKTVRTGTDDREGDGEEWWRIGEEEERSDKASPPGAPGSGTPDA
ncbi:tetratricopeptide repeat protein [Varunaivibrio sulfuroxidans]|uniref:Tetratricopeptide repeat protein n=1 Tax=Varunaivibrio sulfuroxidans TaxID=1773489 RepID=A0A4R3JJD6_9PROT|nr:hypothetical protein [Varunaivibrio sulfuroxidans]TCS64980.1 hypothetical protein EDD55_101312 [Varunaivibrio sulfuroxidans]WES29729.1 hypothetical protein P3M64_08710 [Varunaivibrio sulfuroxidans]